MGDGAVAGDAPVLRTASYDGNLTVTATWELLPGHNDFIVTVRDAGTPVKSGDGRGFVGRVTLDAPITGTTYEVSAAWKSGDTQGPYGNWLPLVTAPLTGVSVRTEPTEVAASWTPPGGAVNAAVLELDHSGSVVKTEAVEGTSGAVPLSAPLTGEGWSLRASAAIGGSTGPAVTVPLVVAQPELTVVAYDRMGRRLDVVFKGPVPFGYDPGAALFADGILAKRATGTGMLVTFSLDAELDPSKAWTARAFWQLGAAQGPYRESVDIMIEAPAVREARWDGTQLYVAWTEFPGPPYATGADVTVFAGGESNRSKRFPGQLSGSFAPEPPLNPGVNYEVAVSSVRGLSRGSLGAPVPVLTTQSSIDAISYDGRTLTASWSAKTPTNASGCELLVQQAGTIVGRLPAWGGRAAGSVDLDPASAYTVALRWTAERSSGAPGPPLTLLAGAPLLEAADATADRVTIGWLAPPTPADVTVGYSAVFSGPGLNPVITALSGASPQTVALPDAAKADPLRALDVAVIATAASGASHGPASERFPVLRAAPALLAAVADSATSVHVDLGRNAQPERGYRVIVFKDGTPYAHAELAEPHGTITLPPPGTDDTATYTLTALAIAGQSSGPEPATRLTLVLAAPTLSDPTFDGRTLTATVSAPGGGAPAPTAYALTLLRDGTAVQRASVAAAGTVALPVDEPTARGASYRLVARAVAAAATGPAAIADVLLDAPEVVAVRCDTQIEVTVSRGVLASGLTLQAGLFVDGGHPTVAPVGADGKATFALPSGTIVEVAAQATDGGATGPWSAHVRVPITRPAITAAFSGRTLALAWSGDADATYDVRVLQGTTVVATTLARGRSAQMALDIIPATAYTAQVTELAGVASGPPATCPLLTDGCAITAAKTVGDTVTLKLAPATGVIELEPVLVTATGETSLGRHASVPELSVVVPAGTAGGAAIAVRPHAGAVAGPLGNAAAVIGGVPRGLRLTYDGTTIAATWDHADDPRVGGYEATLLVDGVVSQTHDVTPPTTSFDYSPPAPPAAPTVTVAVAFVAGLAKGSPGAGSTALLHAPALASAIVDGTSAAVSWSAVAGATAYEIAFPGTAAPALVVAGTSATATLPPGAATLQLTALAAGVRGPASSPQAIIANAPLLTACSFDPASGKLDVSWTAVAGADGYTVELTAGLSPAVTRDVATTSIALGPSELPPGNPIAIRVRARSGATLAGPWSGTEVGTPAAPQNVRVRYDGRIAHVTWTAVPGEGVSGYRVTVSAPGVAAVTTQGTSADVAVPATAGATATVVVQALTAAGSGLASAAVALFSPGLYVSTDATLRPHLAPAATPTLAGADIVVHLPNLFTGTPTLPTNPTFQLTAGSGPLPYTLTIPAGSRAWTFTPNDNPIRDDVKRDYDALLASLASVLTPQGWHFLQDAIGRALPQTFAESLFYGCGFSPSGGYVDLRPGTILRIASEAYQYVGPSAHHADLIDGYVGTGLAEYEIGTFPDGAGRWLTGFDAFLAAVTESGTAVPAPHGDGAGNVAGGGGAVDLFYPAFRQQFFRIVYPPTLLRPDDPGMPEAGSNVAVVGAGDYQTLEQATTAIRRDGSIAAGAVATYLRGRATLTACMRIRVDDVSAVVPIGTTVGNVLDGMARRPPLADALPVDGVTLVRSTGAAIVDGAAATAGYDAAGGVPVRLDWAAGPLWGTSIDRFELPLLPGDRLELGRH